MFYRALNGYDTKNYESNGIIYANIIRSFNENEKNKKNIQKRVIKIFNEVYFKNMSLSLDRVIAHVTGKNMKYTCWISTSKSFNFVAEEYSIPQNGTYNVDMSRKNIAIIAGKKVLDAKNVRNEAGRENIINHFGEYLDISNNRLNDLYEKECINPLYKNKDSYYSSESFKDVLNSDKTRIDGFNNFAASAEEVLFFTKIEKDDIVAVISPLMQDIIYTFSKGLKGLEEEQVVLEKLKEFVNIDSDINNFKKYNFTNEEINLIKFLYTQREDGLYNSLVDLISYFYNEQINIMDLYELLKEIKKSILRKITKKTDIELLDNEIYVLDYEHICKKSLLNGKKINNTNKHDIIYYTDEAKKLIKGKIA